MKMLMMFITLMVVSTMALAETLTLGDGAALELVQRAIAAGTWWERIIILLPLIHIAASAIVAATDTPKDDHWWGKVYKVLELFAGVTDKAKQKPGEADKDNLP